MFMLCDGQSKHSFQGMIIWQASLHIHSAEKKSVGLASILVKTGLLANLLVTKYVQMDNFLS